MKINNKQSRTIIIGIVLIVVAILIWLGFGGEIFTKTEVLVEKYDEILGTSYKEWKDQFILGLDYTIGFISVIIFIASIIIWKQREKGN